MPQVGTCRQTEKFLPRTSSTGVWKAANGGATEGYQAECDQWASAYWPFGQYTPRVAIGDEVALATTEVNQMLLATMVLLGALPQSGELARSVANNSATVPVTVAANNSSEARTLPSMPQPKVDVHANASGAEAIQPPQPALPFQPTKAAYTRPRETRGQRVAWYALAVTGHGAAAFDAYSTRLALSGGYGTESNPLLRPFAHSSALYAATQVSPAVMDFLGKRMMVSEHRWVRRMWWLPQMAGSGVSVAAGVHNMSVVK